MKLIASIAAASLLFTLAACGNQPSNTASDSTASPTTAQSPMSGMSPTTAQSPASPATGTTTQATANKVDVTETEMAIALSTNSIPAGPTSFVVQNKGQEGHELVIFKTDVPLSQLPTKDGKLDEDSPQLQNVADTGETELKSNETRTLQANLTPGNYVAICNVEDHFSMGMKTAFTVK